MRMKMTVQDAAQFLDIKAYDCTLPQAMVDEMQAIGHDTRGFFVYCYDNSLFGYPRPILKAGNEMLKAYNEKYNTYYETEFFTID